MSDTPKKPDEKPALDIGKSSEKSSDNKGDRIAKVLARSGVASRREAEKMITDKRVSVNGKIITSPALNVLANAKILVDGKPIAAPDPPRVWRYHKKRGLVTTERDPQGRKTVFDVMPKELPRMMSVGRLDINTEGLLLMTNDGGLKRYLELPETGWLRRYRVRAYGRPNMKKLEEIKNGVVIDRIVYRQVDLEVERKQGDNFWLAISLREGKNREIKKLLEYAGLEVNRLIRLSFGPFQLGNLATGAVEEVPRRILRQQFGSAWLDLTEGIAPQRSVGAKKDGVKKNEHKKYAPKKPVSKGVDKGADKGTNKTASKGTPKDTKKPELEKKFTIRKPAITRQEKSDVPENPKDASRDPWNMKRKK